LPEPTVVNRPVRLGPDDLMALRTLVREELRLAQERDASAPADAARTTAQVIDQLDPAKFEAYQRAREVVEHALTAGSYAQDDQRTLRQNLDGLPAEVQQEVVLPLIRAANDGTVRLQGHLSIL
jgi:hypothetical protein